MNEKCGCGHEHENNHCHDHRRHHSSHEILAEEFAESALRTSMRREIFLDAPASAKAVVAQKMSVLSEIAERVAFEDIILGHIKALIDFGNRKVNISITRLDERLQSFDDFEDFDTMGYTLTVNVLSLHNTDAKLDGLMEKLLVIQKT